MSFLSLQELSKVVAKQAEEGKVSYHDIQKQLKVLNVKVASTGTVYIPSFQNFV